MAKRSFVKEIREAAPGVFDFLTRAELAAGLELSDVEFRRDYGNLRVLVTITTWDVDAGLILTALRAIAQIAGATVETPRRPYRSIAQPSGSQLPAHVHCHIDGITVDIQALFDADAYAAAVEAEHTMGVAA